MQGEDEIASIGYCLGASMAGLKSMTATSVPGISLYSEQVSFAIGSEIPLVIIDRIVSKEEKFFPFEVKEGCLAPQFLPIGGKNLVRQTSSTHGVNTPDGR